MNADLNLESLGPADRAAIVEVIAEFERRGLQWPCYWCRVHDLFTGENVALKNCTHAMPKSFRYEDALRETLQYRSATNQ